MNATLSFFFEYLNNISFFAFAVFNLVEVYIGRFELFYFL